MHFVRRIASDFVGRKQIVRIARIVLVCLDRTRRHRLAETPCSAHAYISLRFVEPSLEIPDDPRLIDVCISADNAPKPAIAWIEKSAHLALLGHCVGRRDRPTVQMTIITHCWVNGEGGINAAAGHGAMNDENVNRCNYYNHIMKN